MAVELEETNKKVTSPACESASGAQQMQDEQTGTVTSPAHKSVRGTQQLEDEQTGMVTSPARKSVRSTQQLRDEHAEVVMSPTRENASRTQRLANDYNEAVMSPASENASEMQQLVDEHAEEWILSERALDVKADVTHQEKVGLPLEWEKVTQNEKLARQSAPVTAPSEAAMHATGMRYRLLDVVRGVTLLNMIVYHLLYDLVHIFGVAMPWYTSSVGYVWQQAICWTFIFISGLSCNFSHGNAARGVRLLLFGAAMTLVTWLAMPEQLVVFGVLSFLGCAGIIYALLEKLLKKIPAWLGLVVSAAMFLFTKGVPAGFVGVGDLPLVSLPAGWYSVYAMFPVGFTTADFYSSDYFSIIPWIFLYFAGFFFWCALRNRSLFELRGTIKLPILELIGRNTLPIYLVHQPLIYGVLWIIFLIMRH